MPKTGRAQNTVNRRSFWPYRVVGGRGRSPSLLRRGEKRRSAMPRPGGGPLADLSAYARQPARGPTMLAHLVAMLGYVGLMLTHVEPKDPKNGKRKKTGKRRIF